MSTNRGKAFEDQVKKQWQECFPGTFFMRLYDQVSGYKIVSQNPCDALAFVKGNLWLIECKSHDGSSIDFSAIPQYERLLNYKYFKNVHPGILVWFKQKDKVIWFPIDEAEKIHNSGEKSLGLRHLGKYDIYEIPSEKLRVFMKTDYNKLVEWELNRCNFIN